MISELSPTQIGVLEHMRALSEPLGRRSGGFWTCPSVPFDASKTYDKVPMWYCTIATVRALERLGYLERGNEFPEEWRDTRRLVGGKS